MSRSRIAQSSLRALALLLIVTLVAACAQVNTNGIRRHHGLQLPKPVALVIYDFEPTGTSIGLGTGRGTDGEEGLLSKDEMKLRRETGRVLADVVAAELDSRGILTSRKSGPINVPRTTMAVGGQVVTVEDGSSPKRILIGFGSGKSKLTSAAQLYANTNDVPAVVWEYQNTAASGSKPGILTTLPIGAAIQGFTFLLLVINGGLATLGELSSSTSANAKRMGKELADSVEDTLRKVTTDRR